LDLHKGGYREKILRAGLLAALILFGFGGLSNATTLYTSPLEIDFAGDSARNLLYALRLAYFK